MSMKEIEKIHQDYLDRISKHSIDNKQDPYLMQFANLEERLDEYLEAHNNGDKAQEPCFDFNDYTTIRTALSFAYKFVAEYEPENWNLLNRKEYD